MLILGVAERNDEGVNDGEEEREGNGWTEEGMKRNEEWRRREGNGWKEEGMRRRQMEGYCVNAV